MGLPIHLGYLLLLFKRPFNRVKHILGAFTSNSGHTEWEVLHCVLLIGLEVGSGLLDVLRPLVVSLVRLAKRLLELGSVLLLFELIELISQPTQCLGFNHFTHMLTPISLLAESVAIRDSGLIFKHAWMDLLNTWLVLE
jgi:hypothetical protein